MSNLSCGIWRTALHCWVVGCSSFCFLPSTTAFCTQGTYIPWRTSSTVSNIFHFCTASPSSIKDFYVFNNAITIYTNTMISTCHAYEEVSECYIQRCEEDFRKKMVLASLDPYREVHLRPANDSHFELLKCVHADAEMCLRSLKNYNYYSLMKSTTGESKKPKI